MWRENRFGLTARGRGTLPCSANAQSLGNGTKSVVSNSIWERLGWRHHQIYQLIPIIWTHLCLVELAPLRMICITRCSLLRSGTFYLWLWWSWPSVRFLQPPADRLSSILPKLSGCWCWSPIRGVCPASVPLSKSVAGCAHAHLVNDRSWVGTNQKCVVLNWGPQQIARGPYSVLDLAKDFWFVQFSFCHGWVQRNS